MGNMTLFRNFEYIAERASGVRRRASGESASGFRLPAEDARSLDSGGTLSERPSSARDDNDSAERSSCFHEKRPLSRRTSSVNSFLRRSRSRKPESGAYPMRNFAIISSVS